MVSNDAKRRTRSETENQGCSTTVIKKPECEKSTEETKESEQQSLENVPEGSAPVSNVDNDALVLPPTTSCGEEVTNCHVDVEELSERIIPVEEDKTEEIYSSLPPDLNAEIMHRSSRTPPIGVYWIVNKKDGVLRIKLNHEKLKESRPESYPGLLTGSSVIDSSIEHQCVVCSRTIACDELYLNFPEDLDRRRLWGGSFGFRYKSMLRVKSSNNASSSCISFICTDHFSEECLRRFNFNKAAIETFGIPILLNAEVAGTPAKKRAAWDCTICSFKAFSVCELRDHLLEHCKAITEKEFDRNSPVQKALRDRGLACPFCRKCTYGYKTVSGFARHLNTSPKAHFYLKRIYDIAFKSCRSSYLDPVDEWQTWSEKNVVLAYHGCEPPSDKSPSKRSMIGSDSGSVDSPSPTKRSTQSVLSAETESPKKPTPKSSQKTEQPPRISLAERERLKSLEDASVRNSVKRRDSLVRSPRPPAARRIFNPSLITDEIHISSHDGGSCEELQEETVIEEGYIDDFEVVEEILEYDDSPDKSEISAALSRIPSGRFSEQVDDNVKIMRSTIINPGFVAGDVRGLRNYQRKTQRQLEANEARLRLFGDTTYVDVPTGYVKVETPGGLRMMNKQMRSLEQQMDVSIANRRFQPLN